MSDTYDYVVGFTGTKDGLTELQYGALLTVINFELPGMLNKAVHGDCIGADAAFHTIVKKKGLYVSVRPGCDGHGKSPKRAYCDADFVYDPEPYLARNRKIVSDVDVMIACPKEMHEERRSGTWATIRYAVDWPKPMYIIFPDSTITKKG